MTTTKDQLDAAMRAVERFGAEPELAPGFDDGPYVADQSNMDKAAEKAAKAGMTLVYGEPDTLLLDLDDGAAVNIVVLKKLVENVGEYTMASWISKSGNGEHMLLRFKDAQWSHAEAIALEVSLGSDPIRGMLGIERLRQKVTNPRVLFKPRLPFDPPRL